MPGIAQRLDAGRIEQVEKAIKNVPRLLLVPTGPEKYVPLLEKLLLYAGPPAEFSLVLLVADDIARLCLPIPTHLGQVATRRALHLIMRSPPAQVNSFRIVLLMNMSVDPLIAVAPDEHCVPAKVQAQGFVGVPEAGTDALQERGICLFLCRTVGRNQDAFPATPFERSLKLPWL